MPFPIWDDVRTFDGRPWHGHIDVISGGFPCQDISAAGKGAGLAGERSGLWSEYVRIIRDVEPRFVFVENSPALTLRGFGEVLGDLASLGFDARWGVFSAADAGARHRRERIWILASDPVRAGLEGSIRRSAERFFALDDLVTSDVFPQHQDDLPAPQLLGSGHGLANFVDRSRAIGNGQVPAVVRLAWEALTR
jgi:DNA (cytosine-5)-methyltransferase 1